MKQLKRFALTLAALALLAAMLFCPAVVESSTFQWMS